MSNFQKLVVTPTQEGFSNQCLTGCMYQVVQNPGVQERNVLQLIPVLNAKDNPVQVFPSSFMPNTPVLNVAQPVRLSLPSAVSNVTLPCPVNAQLVQQLGSANYIITTQKNPADASKTIRVDKKLPAHQNTTVFLEKPQLSLPSNSQTGPQSFIIMNTKPASVPLKTMPFFQPGQIPNTEVKSTPASSAPFSLQQRFLPPNTSINTPTIPSLIYVSPVNTVKTPPTSSNPNKSMTTIKQSSPILLPSVNPSTAVLQGPLKWIVQENKESKACIVPVKSTSDTTSQVLTVMPELKTEELHLPSSTGSNVTKMKGIMRNNKIYILAKQGTVLKSPVHIKQESSAAAPIHVEQGKDLANKVVEVVLSKNSLSSPNSKQTLNSDSSQFVHPNANSPAKSKTFTPSKASKDISEVIYIDDDDDEDVTASIQKPQNISNFLPKDTASSKLFTPSPSLSCSSHRTDDQAKDKKAEMTKSTDAPMTHISDQTLRAKFGLFKQEKIILSRIPVLHSKSKSDSGSPNKDMVVYSKSQDKRKSDCSETSKISKKRKSTDSFDPNMEVVTEDPSGNYSRLSSTTTLPGTSNIKHATTSGERLLSSMALTATNTGQENSSTSLLAQNSGPEAYTDPSQDSFYVEQVITGSINEASLPRQRFHIESSVYPDETTKDEKIQRLKAVLKEREQALEALRRQKWS
ncbi:ligand-dependent nuclear receptor-interacting factor 1-like [Pyxicephalus adspersus]|uniref:Ligand-dependent nuclear receptor-interacting factor 1 n=1 Tax=Pyxicephalus adspersus TaxID=30357 RepID=A0AAV3ALG2_PYXAD|nr:TPA: hypothetical protein GDO54_000070 [Pyxicephalus adspersus]